MSTLAAGKLRVFAVAGTAALGIDQFAKAWFFAQPPSVPGSPVLSLFGENLSVMPRQSSEFAFGLLKDWPPAGQDAFLVLVALIFAGLVVSFYRGLGSAEHMNAFALGLLVGGGLGNLADWWFRGAGLALFRLGGGPEGSALFFSPADGFVLFGLVLLGAELLVAEGAARAKTHAPIETED